MNRWLPNSGTMIDGFEFVFVRLAPFAFIASAIGIAISYEMK